MAKLRVVASNTIFLPDAFDAVLQNGISFALIRLKAEQTNPGCARYRNYFPQYFNAYLEEHGCEGEWRYTDSGAYAIISMSGEGSVQVFVDEKFRYASWQWHEQATGS